MFIVYKFLFHLDNYYYNELLSQESIQGFMCVKLEFTHNVVDKHIPYQHLRKINNHLNTYGITLKFLLSCDFVIIRGQPKS